LISVVTWDAGFRESYHTVDYFARQDLDRGKFEFVWSDYYGDINPALQEKIEGMGNGRVFIYGGEGQEWHLGRCLNSSVSECVGDILVIPDGDIAVEENFLREIVRCFNRYDKCVLYFRRWDEPLPAVSCDRVDMSHLKKVCRLSNPINYGGCLALPRGCFDQVFGYEEHELFSGAGANGLELFTRLKNAGFPIMWHPSMKIFHPWHEGTMYRGSEYQRKLKMQKWLILQRDLRVACLADHSEVQFLIEQYHVDGRIPNGNRGIVSRVKRLFGL
jgi:hypothetical protein